MAPSSLYRYLGFYGLHFLLKKKAPRWCKRRQRQLMAEQPAGLARSARQTTLTHRGGPLRPWGVQASPRPPPMAAGRVLPGATPAPLGRRRRCQAAALVPRPPGRLLGNPAPQRRSLPAAPARCPRRHCGAAAHRGALRAPPRVWGPEPPAPQRGGVGAASPAQPGMGCDKRKGPFWCLNAVFALEGSQR